MNFPRPLVFLTAWITLSLSVTLRAEEPAPAKSSTQAPRNIGLIWRVDGGKSPLYLAGAFHLMKPEDYPLPAAYTQAWQESRQVVFEVAPGEMEKPEVMQRIVSMGTLKGKKLQSMVSADTWKKLSEWGAKSGTPASALQPMQPWMAGLTVAVESFRTQGYQTRFGMERFFENQLPGSGKTASGLETAVGQIGIFTRIDPKQQEDVLRQSLEEAVQPEKIEELISAWRTGDEAALHERMHRSFRDFPDLEKTLLTDRNTAWIPALEKMLQGDQATFVMVGSGHLCGPGSVVDLLGKKGYKPVRLLPADQPAGAVESKPDAAPAPAVNKAA